MVYDHYHRGGGSATQRGDKNISIPDTTNSGTECTCKVRADVGVLSKRTRKERPHLPRSVAATTVNW